MVAEAGADVHRGAPRCLEGGKRKKLYLGKTNDPESTLAAKRAKLSAE